MTAGPSGTNPTVKTFPSTSAADDAVSHRPLHHSVAGFVPSATQRVWIDSAITGRGRLAGVLPPRRTRPHSSLRRIRRGSLGCKRGPAVTLSHEGGRAQVDREAVFAALVRRTTRRPARPMRRSVLNGTHAVSIAGAVREATRWLLVLVVGRCALSALRGTRMPSVMSCVSVSPPEATSRSLAA